MSRAAVRTLLHTRQDGLCGICDEELPSGFLHSRHVNLDHTRPRSHGGPDHPNNITLTHRRCNLAKGSSCAGCEGCPKEG
ncbi:HNH endonuclease [Uniformispora flossi]